MTWRYLHHAGVQPSCLARGLTSVKLIILTQQPPHLWNQAGLYRPPRGEAAPAFAPADFWPPSERWRSHFPWCQTPVSSAFPAGLSCTPLLCLSQTEWWLEHCAAWWMESKRKWATQSYFHTCTCLWDWKRTRPSFPCFASTRKSLEISNSTFIVATTTSWKSLLIQTI